MNPPPLELPETLWLSQSDAPVPAGNSGHMPLIWDGQSWIGSAKTCHANLGCEAY